MSRKISESTIRRLSLYLRSLERLAAEGVATVSSEDLAIRGATTAAQVRKDLSFFGSFGKRGLGYTVLELASELREILGLGRDWRVALIGAGRIGSALFEYQGFRERGFHIRSVLDSDPRKVGARWGEVAIRPMTELERVLRREKIDIVIVAVPAAAAQEIVSRVAGAGVRGVLNFAPLHLQVPERIALKDVNMVLELEALSFALARGKE